MKKRKRRKEREKRKVVSVTLNKPAEASRRAEVKRRQFVKLPFVLLSTGRFMFQDNESHRRRSLNLKPLKTENLSVFRRHESPDNLLVENQTH